MIIKTCDFCKKEREDVLPISNELFSKYVSSEFKDICKICEEKVYAFAVKRHKEKWEEIGRFAMSLNPNYYLVNRLYNKL